MTLPLTGGAWLGGLSHTLGALVKPLYVTMVPRRPSSHKGQFLREPVRGAGQSGSLFFCHRARKAREFEPFEF